ncbi:hypothetical protein [Bradyrhizobium sp. WSM3983]|uniref:hypothetical protein n=1 Tax=Bradyrhizobium sp. WSM3983 TaxID=1038867 RepID=UPI000423B829
MPQLGAARCPRKPFTPDALLAAVRDCLAEQRAAAAQLHYRVIDRDAREVRVRLPRAQPLRTSAQHRQTVAHAIPIARDLIQFARAVHIPPYWQAFFTRVVALLSARLPVAFPT